MQRFTACLGSVAMFVALLTAPLFHLHDRDDHGSPKSLVHAHFLETESPSHHTENEFENRHSHEHARWVEFFTFIGPQASFELAVDFSETFSAPLLEVREGVNILAVPRSHGPPSARPSVPRSPPTT